MEFLVLMVGLTFHFLLTVPLPMYLVETQTGCRSCHYTSTADRRFCPAWDNHQHFHFYFCIGLED